MDVAINVIWFIGAVIAWYPASEWLIEHLSDNPLHRGEDVFFGRAIGCIVAFVWPLFVALIVPWLISRWLYMHSPWRVKRTR